MAEVGTGLRSEGSSYLATLRNVLLSPRAFVDGWRTRGDAMNPLGFLAVSVLILGSIRSFGWSFLQARGSEFAREIAGVKPFWAEIWGAAGPTLHFAALGLIVHGTLRLLGNRRAAAQDSAALTFYCAGSAALVLEVLAWGVTLVLLTAGVLGLDRIFNVLFLGFGISLGGFCALLGYTLGVLHAPRWWHMPLAFLAAFVLTGLFFGHIDPPGDYGLRWFLQLWGPRGFLLELRL